MNAASSICMYKQCQRPGVRGDDRQILPFGCIILHLCLRDSLCDKKPQSEGSSIDIDVKSPLLCKTSVNWNETAVGNSVKE